jgi:Protein of unknown function (DUF1573)
MFLADDPNHIRKHQSATIQQHTQTQSESIGFYRWGREIVAFLSGGVLVLAAGVKSYFLGLEAGGDFSQEQGAGLLRSLAEFSLGLWILSGAWRRRAWAVSVFWFATCLCWSLAHWWSGAASCGCAGRVTISPLVSASLSLILLAGLLTFRPRRDAADGGAQGEASRLRLTVCGVAEMLVIFYVATFVILGSPRWVLAYFEAPPIVIVPSRIEVGSCRFGELREVELALKNVTPRPVRIQSIQTTCSCTTVADPPQELGPGGLVHLRLKIQCVGPPDVPYHQTIRVYAVDAGLHTVPIDVFATVTGPFPQPKE